MEKSFSGDSTEDVEEELSPTLENILDKKSLKWIFVGGKGGVGKTTCSCSLAVLLSKVRESVLIISTDPAHNLSDAFNQKFGRQPNLVKGFTNLFAMEVEVTGLDDEDKGVIGGTEGAEENAVFQNLAGSIPGIDEAMSFAEVMKQVQTMQFSVVVFDTAPTGHTLRFLSFPSVLGQSLSKIISLKSKFTSIFQQLTSLMGTAAESEESVATKLEATMKVIQEVNSQFSNPNLTTFICVCIPEFLSLYETERLIQELAKFRIDTGNILVNQIVYPKEGSKCGLCISRSKMQNKYLSQIKDLYEFFHVVKLPLLQYEIRGVDLITQFAQFLVVPYQQQEGQKTPLQQIT